MKIFSIIRDYFRLGIIIGPLPYQIADGQIIDAVPVMGDLNYMISQVNANAQPLAGAIGTVPVYVPVVGGTPNAITLTPVTPISSYAAGQAYTFIATGTNTGATTIATSGLAPRQLRYADGTQMTGGELQVGAIYSIEDTGAVYILMNSAQATGLVAWTPTLTFGGANVGMTYGLQSGISSKIGRFVLHAFVITLTAKGVSVGNMAVNGLPYVVNAAWLGNNAGPIVASNLTFPANSYNVFGYNLGTTTMSGLNIPSASAFVSLADTNFANNTTIAGQAFYAT